MEPVVPYLVVVGVACLVTLAELLLTFGSSFFHAFRTPWTWLLIGANTGFALSTYAIAAATLNIGTGVVYAVAWGLLFPAILRSRFTFFRAVGDKDDTNSPNISIPLDKYYSAIQKRCYREVDSWQAAHRMVKAQALATRWEEERIVSAIKKIIAARQVIAEQKADERYLGELCALTDQEMRKYRLAMFLIDIAGGKENALLAE